MNTEQTSENIFTYIVYNLFVTNNYTSFHFWWNKRLVKHLNILGRIQVCFDSIQPLRGAQ